MTHALGELNGFEWIDFQFDDFPDKMMTPSTRGRTGPVRIIAVKGHLPAAHTLKTWGEKDPYFGSYFSPDTCIRPFDEAAMFPDSPVTYLRGSFSELQADAWARNMVQVPETLDLRFDYVVWRNKFHVYARTMKDGAEIEVRRKIAGVLPFAEEMASHIRYFERNCPRIDAAASVDLVCGAHVNGILSGLVGEGRDHVARWAGRLAHLRADTTSSVTITRAMLYRLPGLNKVQLMRGERSTMIHMTADIDGGHRIEDDAQGITIEMKAQLPDAVVGSLKGRSMGDVIDLPWLRGVTIRAARIKDDKVIIRGFAPREALHVPDRSEDDSKAVGKHLDDLLGRKDGIEKIDDSVLPYLKVLPPARLLAVLSLVQADGRVSLDDYGTPGWRLRTMHTTVQMESCPTTDARSLLKDG